MTELDKVFEAILTHKARQMIEGARKGAFGKHLRELLVQLGITQPDDAFVIGAIDAMIFDMANATDFARETRAHANWIKHEKRSEFIEKLWKELLP